MENHLTAYLRDLEVRNYSPLSIQKYSICLKRFLGFLTEKGVSDIREVDREVLGEFSEVLSKNPRYSVHYVGSNIRAVKGFFRYLRKARVVLYDFSVVLSPVR